MDTLRAYRDDGLLAELLARGLSPLRVPRVMARFAWIVPALVRAGEYGVIALLGWLGGRSVLPVIYGLLAAMAFHHYDIVYRLRHQRTPLPAWVGRLGLGWEGRILVLLAAALLDVLLPVATALAIWCGALFVTESVFSWVRIARDADRTIAVAAHDDEE